VSNPTPGPYQDPNFLPGAPAVPFETRLDPNAHANDQKRKAISIGVLILAGIGLAMSMQSVSLFSGTGTLWTGVGLAAAGTASAFFLGAEKWARVIAAVCLAVALLATIAVEVQMNEKRQEISDIFNG
jgi:O-antigen ligase